MSHCNREQETSQSSPCAEILNRPGYYLGPLCRRAHKYMNTNQSIRNRGGQCYKCTEIARRKRESTPEFKEKERLRRERDKERLRKNPTLREQRNAKLRERRRKNPEVYRSIDRRHKERNREKIREDARRRYYANHEKNLELDRAKRERNRESIRKADRESKRRRRRDAPELVKANARRRYRKNTVLARLRVRLRRAFNDYSIQGKRRSSDEYGIDYMAIIDHLGPCPGEPSDWHIDHIRPLISFDWDDPEQIKAAFAPENHQWLPAHENLRKSAKHDKN